MLKHPDLLKDLSPDIRRCAEMYYNLLQQTTNIIRSKQLSAFYLVIFESTPGTAFLNKLIRSSKKISPSPALEEYIVIFYLSYLFTKNRQQKTRSEEIAIIEEFNQHLNECLRRISESAMLEHLLNFIASQSIRNPTITTDIIANGTFVKDLFTELKFSKRILNDYQWLEDASYSGVTAQIPFKIDYKSISKSQIYQFVYNVEHSFRRSFPKQKFPSKEVYDICLELFPPHDDDPADDPGVEYSAFRKFRSDNFRL